MWPAGDPRQGFQFQAPGGVPQYPTGPQQAGGYGYARTGMPGSAPSPQAMSFAPGTPQSPQGGQSMSFHGGGPHSSFRQRQLSSPTYAGPECNDECAEEDCNPEMCGDENRAPKGDIKTVCGFEFRYYLPCTLSASTAVSFVLMMLVQVPLLRRDLGTSWLLLDAPMACLYVGTLLCLAYCAIADPGKLLKPKKRSKKRGAKEPITSVEELEEAKGLTDGAAAGEQLPRRAHKTWLYDLAIRRYSHYCRWLCNCVGLLNHREYILMCLGIVATGAVGAAVDVYVVLATYAGVGGGGGGVGGAALPWTHVALVVMHGLYCGVLIVLGFPILKIHIGLVARNELAAEWKRNDHEVIDRGNGQSISVNELDDDEFNERFDSFVYDRSRNKFDKGCCSNCLSFWCTKRWSRSQLGDF